MRRAWQAIWGRRPRTGAVAAVGVVALAAGGVGWATTRSGTTVIKACANADNALFLSTNGSCPSGQTLLSWNQQGPQGPPGTSPPPVRAFGPSAYHNGFSIKAQIDQPGDYFIDGSVDLALTPSLADNKHRPFTASCYLYSGPTDGSASIIAKWTLHFGLHKPPPLHYVPSSASGLVDVNTVQSLTADQIPREIYLTCRGGADAVWTHPSITFELTTGSVFHQTVGPALPKKPVIGPGLLRKVFGAS